MQRLVTNVAGEENTIIIINTEHSRAHRNTKEMKLQILEKFYFPRMASRIRSLVSSFRGCKMLKLIDTATNH